MSDDLKIRRPQDPQRINVNEPWEVTHWSKKFGVSESKLREAVAAVGVMVSAVEKYLKGQR